MNDIRHYFLDTTDRAVRNRYQGLCIAQGFELGGVVGQAVGALFCLIGTLSLVVRPSFGISALLTGLSSILISNEISLVGRNMDHIITSNLVLRTYYVLTAENFVEVLTKDTLFLSRLNSVIAKNLNSARYDCG